MTGNNHTGIHTHPSVIARIGLLFVFWRVNIAPIYDGSFLILNNIIIAGTGGSWYPATIACIQHGNHTLFLRGKMGGDCTKRVASCHLRPHSIGLFAGLLGSSIGYRRYEPGLHLHGWPGAGWSGHHILEGDTPLSPFLASSVAPSGYHRQLKKSGKLPE